MDPEEDSIRWAPLERPQFLCGGGSGDGKDSVWGGLGSCMRIARPPGLASICSRLAGSPFSLLGNGFATSWLQMP